MQNHRIMIRELVDEVELSIGSVYAFLPEYVAIAASVRNSLQS